jgi:hypothetical protein
LSPGGTEGKWAEDAKSEESSVDEFDSISMRGRKIKLPSTTQQNGDNSDGIKARNTEEKLGGNEESDNMESEKLNENFGETSLDNDNENKESENLNEVSCEKVKEVNGVLGEETVTSADNIKQTTANDMSKQETNKPLSAKPRKKVKNIRFKDEIIVKNNKGGETDKDNESGENNKDEKSDHVNPYLDDWLGIKKKQVDGRYKPGKPPPNRFDDCWVFWVFWVFLLYR